MPDARQISAAGSGADDDTISIVQRGNLRALEKTLRKQWRMGQNIVLCWSANENGVMVLFVPHYFLGNYSATEGGTDEAKESFVRSVISGHRHKAREDFFEVANRLGVSPTFIKLSVTLSDDEMVVDAVEQIIKRYGISYVSSRAVLLFDIANFSLFSPFEQASQLNSLSYSMNSAYNKLLTRGVEINFARTTTGDGYYVWNRDLAAEANLDLFHFMLLVVADNATAQMASKGNTVPVIRTAFHIGSHYELYQAEGINPTVFSYIVGDVTIELARMVDLAQPGQIFLGEFNLETALDGEDAEAVKPVSAPEFVSQSNERLVNLNGIQFAGKVVTAMNCELSAAEAESGIFQPRRFRITDKHGISRYVYNLMFEMRSEDSPLCSAGLKGDFLPGKSASTEDSSETTGGTVDGHSIAALKNRNNKEISED